MFKKMFKKWTTKAPDLSDLHVKLKGESAPAKRTEILIQIVKLKTDKNVDRQDEQPR